MGEFYGVMFKRECRGIFQDAGQGGIDLGDYVVVESEGGQKIGRVIQKGELAAYKGGGREVGRVVRRATPDDLEQLRERREKEAEALRVCQQRVAHHNLKMKPVDVKYACDGARITFYFTANGRIDFRELVRDLARTYRTRIEMWQIGFRAEARRMGGYGVCGRALCCATFLQKSSPVSVQVARDQTSSQNASKLTGICGQLKCCLAFDQASGAGCASCCHGPSVGDDVLQDEEGLEELPLVEAQE